MKVLKADGNIKNFENWIFRSQLKREIIKAKTWTWQIIPKVKLLISYTNTVRLPNQVES